MSNKQGTLLELLKHTEYFFEMIPSIYDSGIVYRIYLKNRIWGITNMSSGETAEFVDQYDVINYLKDKNADLALFHQMIFGNICHEGSLRRIQLKKCEELVGIDSIDKSDAAFAKFHDGLKAQMKKVGVEVKKSKEEPKAASPKLGLV